MIHAQHRLIINTDNIICTYTVTIDGISNCKIQEVDKACRQVRGTLIGLLKNNSNIQVFLISEYTITTKLHSLGCYLLTIYMIDVEYPFLIIQNCTICSPNVTILHRMVEGRYIQEASEVLAL